MNATFFTSGARSWALSCGAKRDQHHADVDEKEQEDHRAGNRAVRNRARGRGV